MSYDSITLTTSTYTPTNHYITITTPKTHPARAVDFGTAAEGANAATEDAKRAPIARENFIFPIFTSEECLLNCKQVDVEEKETHTQEIQKGEKETSGFASKRCSWNSNG